MDLRVSVQRLSALITSIADCASTLPGSDELTERVQAMLSIAEDESLTLCRSVDKGDDDKSDD